jgi:imidazolonepropionase-like amidohydrolase
MYILKNAKIITGDGFTELEKASIVVKNGIIEGIEDYIADLVETDFIIIDCMGKIIVPGMINHHTHGVVNGPIFASGAQPIGFTKVIEQLDRNLAQGVTTVLSVDGFVTMEEVRETQKLHPLKIKAATTHTPLNFEAADRLDGLGLTSAHREMTVEKMLNDGAVAIGEIGGGHTLGGGGQDYLYIPRAIKKATGKDIDSFQARLLKLAVLGRFIDESACDLEKVENVLQEIGLIEELSPELVKELVVDTVMPSVRVALGGYKEAAELARQFDVPMIAHNAPTSMDVVHQVAAMGLKRLIAAHSNYLYTLEESLENTRKLKQYSGVIIDVAVHDPFGEKRLVSTPDNMFAFFEQGLADIVSTDYAAGKFDSMLLSFEKAIELGKIGLAEAIAMGSKKVADYIPGLAPNRGLLAKGYYADMVIVDDPNISQVNKVIVDGMVVYDIKKGGKICA